MKRDNFFWGTALILVGVLLFLQTQGIIGNVFRYFWPLALILVGSWIILNVYWRPAASEEETFMVPLGSASSLRFRLSHGAGQIEITGGARYTHEKKKSYFLQPYSHPLAATFLPGVTVPL